MKKKILAMLLCLALLFNCGVTMAATRTTPIKEDKTAKVIVDGVPLKTTNVPILNNGTPMLSTELFTALGINAKNQVWDKSKTKLTLTKGKIKLVMQLNSSNVTLSGEKICLPDKPIKYKNKAYFPTDFIAECFNKQFTVDIDTNTYFLKDKTEFAKNKKLLDNILKAMNGVSKLKVSENGTYSIWGPGAKMSVDMTTTTSTDIRSKLGVGDLNIKVNQDGQIINETHIQAALANNKQYMKADGGEWEPQDFTEAEFAELLKFDDTFKYDDTICSALNITKGAKSDEIVLKGNILLGDSISSLLRNFEVVPNKIGVKAIEITLNTKTNVVSRIVLKEIGTVINDGVKLNLSVNYVITYSDINGSFEVVVPEGLN